MTPNSWSPLAQSLLGRAELTALDIARASGLEVDDLRRLWQALGFPPVTDDERRFTYADLEIVREVRALVETHDAALSDVLQLTRVVGHAMAVVSDAQITIIAERLQRRRESGDDRDSAQGTLAGRVETLAPALERFLGYVWRRHVVAAAAQLSAMPSPSDRDLVVGFADLVAFTAMTHALEALELAAIVDRFQAIAHEQVVRHGGRVVKMIGDEVMFCAEDATSAGRIGLALVDAHSRAESLPDIRVGLAGGPVLAWEGDLFGPTVNRASRVVNFARPATVLISDELREHYQSDPDFQLRRLRPVKLKGLGRVPLAVLRTAQSGGKAAP